MGTRGQLTSSPVSEAPVPSRRPDKEEEWVGQGFRCCPMRGAPALAVKDSAVREGSRPPFPRWTATDLGPAPGHPARGALYQHPAGSVSTARESRLHSHPGSSARAREGTAERAPSRDGAATAPGAGPPRSPKDGGAGSFLGHLVPIETWLHPPRRSTARAPAPLHGRFPAGRGRGGDARAHGEDARRAGSSHAEPAPRLRRGAARRQG